MPSKMRSTRKLCSWIIEQVNSKRYPGVIWDDKAQTMFRIPWKHAGKQSFRSNEDAAFFKAWAEFKGNPKKGSTPSDSAANWKTRMRCALNKSSEFSEVSVRSQLDISEPYKVYRLVPLSEQGVVEPPHRKSVKATRQSGKRKLSESGSQEPLDSVHVKHIKEEDVTAPLSIEELLLGGEERETEEPQEPGQQIITLQTGGLVDDEIQLDMRLETAPPCVGVVQDSYQVTVRYMGQEVLRRDVLGSDARVAYVPSSPTPAPPTPTHLVGAFFPRVALPEPRPAPKDSSPAFRLRLRDLSSLLPVMERGVMLTTSARGVYATRYCRGRVFWTGPHRADDAPQGTPRKMERNAAKPTLVFSKTAFNQQLEHFQTHGGEPPQCSITLCFGEELSDTEDPSSKLITAQITLPWAQQQVEEAQGALIVFQCLEGEITLNLVQCP